MVKWIVSAKRWLDKFGNTYHSVVITNARNNKKVYSSGMQYGYGDAYRQTAKDYLTKKGHINKKTWNWDWEHKNLYFDVGDVSAQRDLDKEEYDTLKEKKDVVLQNQMYDKDIEMRRHLAQKKMERKLKKYKR